jgi:hypothetical protein
VATGWVHWIVIAPGKRATVADSYRDQSTVGERLEFLSGSEITLRQRLLQEKLATLHKCVERIQIDEPECDVRTTLRVVPCRNLDGVEVIEVTPRIGSTSYLVDSESERAQQNRFLRALEWRSLATQSIAVTS